MVLVAGGVFEMGCKSGRDDITYSCGSKEMPLHWVKVDSFYIGKYTVTQGLWRKVMGSLPSNIGRDSLSGDHKPVVWVSYNDITSQDGFLDRLNAQTGKNYRLPTEAEWEYAARGCTGGVCESLEFSGCNTIGDVAWYKSNSSTLQPVGAKPANALGIYDMSGGVWECCSDWYGAYPSGTSQSSPQDNPTGPVNGSDHMYRGGNWTNPAGSCRVAYRHNHPASSGNINGFNDVGIRLVLPLRR
jgi:formylglycine-generating enzyme required for sulfatase activity